MDNDFKVRLEYHFGSEKNYYIFYKNSILNLNDLYYEFGIQDQLDDLKKCKGYWINPEQNSLGVIAFDTRRDANKFINKCLVPHKILKLLEGKKYGE